MAPFGIKVLIVEPGAFRTNPFAKDAAYSDEHPAYAEKVGATRQMVRGAGGEQPGDPAKAAAAIRFPPWPPTTPRCGCPRRRRGGLPRRSPRRGQAELTAWEKVSRGTDFDA